MTFVKDFEIFKPTDFSIHPLEILAFRLKSACQYVDSKSAQLFYCVSVNIKSDVENSINDIQN
jgi:hypothetical protein